MDKRLSGLAAALFLAACVLVAPGAAKAEPMDEASLLAAWEQAVLGDPETIALDSLGDNRYYFETTRFPYAGELVVLNMSIDQALGPHDTPMGVVEVELADADDEFYNRFAMSYGQWSQYNFLYYDQETGQWLTAREMDADMFAACDVPWYSSLLGVDLFWLLFLVLCVVFLVFAVGKSSRQMKKAMAAQEKALANNQAVLELAHQNLVLQQETLAVLKDIRDKLPG